jgi:WD40 repeat protein
MSTCVCPDDVVRWLRGPRRKFVGVRCSVHVASGGDAFNPDGAWVATASDDHTARVFDAATGAERCHLTHQDAVLAAAFSPDAARVTTASNKGAAHLMVIDTAVLIAQVGVRMSRELTDAEWKHTAVVPKKLTVINSRRNSSL